MKHVYDLVVIGARPAGQGVDRARVQLYPCTGNVNDYYFD